MPIEPVGRSFGNRVVSLFTHNKDGSPKWLQEQPDGEIWNWEKWPPHVERFTKIQIKANETTEITMTYARIEEK